MHKERQKENKKLHAHDNVFQIKNILPHDSCFILFVACAYVRIHVTVYFGRNFSNIISSDSSILKAATAWYAYLLVTGKFETLNSISFGKLCIWFFGPKRESCTFFLIHVSLDPRLGVYSRDTRAMSLFACFLFVSSLKKEL